MRLTPRVIARLDLDFGDCRDPALDVLEGVDVGPDETEGDERISTAMLLSAAGDLDRLMDAAALAEVDWRDLLVNVGLAGDDWRDAVDAYLAALPAGT